MHKPLLLVVLLSAASPARADVDNLRFLGHNEVNQNHLMDAEIVGSRAFIAVGAAQGVECYDISDPANPQRTWLSNGPNCWRTTACGDTLLLAFCRREGLVIFDISGSGDPVRLGQYNPAGNREALEGGVLIGDTVYCAAHQNGIYAVDVSDPSRPQLAATLPIAPALAWNVVVLDSFLAVANGAHGLAVVGLAGGMHEVSRLELPGCANDVVLDGSIAILSLGPSGIAAVDLTDPHAPVLRGTASTDGCAWGIDIAGGYVAVGSWRVLEVFDVGDPDHIVRAGWDNTQTWAHGAAITDDGLVVVADWRGMSCYDLDADPGPDIDVVPPILDFGPLIAPCETTLLVRNTGLGVLEVSSVTSPRTVSVVPASFSVSPGDSLTITVTATDTTRTNGALAFQSNDPDEAEKRIEVYKNFPAFPEAGTVAPDFRLRGTDSLFHSLSDYRGRVVYLEFGASW